MTGEHVSQAGVARVIASYLVDAGIIGEQEETQWARKLKDPVSDALAGRALKPELLTWFIEAFGMSKTDADELRSLYAGGRQLRFVNGNLAYSPERYGTSPAEHQTVLLHDEYYIDAMGSPTEQRTIQVIQAAKDSIVSYPYRFNSHTVTIEVVAGGHARGMYRINEKLYQADIELCRPLGFGETALLEYSTTFHYACPPRKNRIRRVVVRQAEHLAISVVFSLDRLPVAVWRATWDGLSDTVLSRETVEPDDQGRVHWYLERVEKATVGFCWEWEDGKPTRTLPGDESI